MCFIMCVRERQIRGDFQKSLMTFVKIKNSQNSAFIYIHLYVRFLLLDVPYERRVNKCAYTYQDLVPRTMPSTEEGARYLREY